MDDHYDIPFPLPDYVVYEYPLSWMNWLFHYIDAILSIMISLVIIIVLVSVEWKSGEGRILDFSNPFIIYVFFLLYSMALVAFLFFISTFFNNRK